MSNHSHMAQLSQALRTMVMPLRADLITSILEELGTKLPHTDRNHTTGSQLCVSADRVETRHATPTGCAWGSTRAPVTTYRPVNRSQASWL